MPHTIRNKSLYTHYHIASQIFPFFFFPLPCSPLPTGLSAETEVIKQIPFYSVNPESNFGNNAWFIHELIQYLESSVTSSIKPDSHLGQIYSYKRKEKINKSLSLGN